MQHSVLLFLFVSILICACGSEKEENQVELFNGISISLKEGENIEDVTESDTDAYFEMLGERPYQAPIYRKIKSGSAYLYVGIPVGASKEKILNLKAEANQGESQSWQYSYTSYQKDSISVAEFAAHREGNTVLLVAAGRENEQFNSKFSADSLLSRLQIK